MCACPNSAPPAPARVEAWYTPIPPIVAILTASILMTLNTSCIDDARFGARPIPPSSLTTLAPELDASEDADVVSIDIDKTDSSTEPRRLNFNRFRDEIQPILDYDGEEEGEGRELYRRCTQPTCHHTELGGLRITPSPTPRQLELNYVEVRDAVDEGAPRRSPLLAAPLAGPPAHPVRSFQSADDCCYQVILRWIDGRPHPGCLCP